MDTRDRKQKSGQKSPKATAASNPTEQPNSYSPVRLEGESEPPASNIGGVSGRTMHRRDFVEETDEEVAQAPSEGAMGGTNRSPKILEKNRKIRRAA